MKSFVAVREGDHEIVRSLLEQAKLPTDILESGRGELWLIRDGAATAAGGFEFYGEDALLRSVVVDPAHRSTGIGGRMVDQLLTIAAERHVRRVWLLTETAEKFFAKRGFRKVERSTISNKKLLSSPEFTHVCSTTAVCMVHDLAARSIS